MSLEAVLIVRGHPNELDPGLRPAHPPDDSQIHSYRRLTVDLDPQLQGLPPRERPLGLHLTPGHRAIHHGPFAHTTLAGQGGLISDGPSCAVASRHRNLLCQQSGRSVVRHHPRQFKPILTGSFCHSSEDVLQRKGKCAYLLVAGAKRFRIWVRGSGEGPDDLLDSVNVRQREAHTKFRASGPGHQCLVNTNGLIGSRDDQGKRKRHPGGYLRRTFNMKMVLGEAPHRSCNVPVVMREADHAGDRYR